jgi:hypothetical protein
MRAMMTTNYLCTSLLEYGVLLRSKLFEKGHYLSELGVFRISTATASSSDDPRAGVGLVLGLSPEEVDVFIICGSSG